MLQFKFLAMKPIISFEDFVFCIAEIQSCKKQEIFRKDLKNGMSNRCFMKKFSDDFGSVTVVSSETALWA